MEIGQKKNFEWCCVVFLKKARQMINLNHSLTVMHITETWSCGYRRGSSLQKSAA